MRNSIQKNNIITEYLLPIRIVLENNCVNSSEILNEMERQIPLCDKSDYLKIEKGGYIILDFGKELQGGAVITLPDVKQNSHLRLVFGESVSEAMSSIGEKNATNDHAIRDMIVPISSWQTARHGYTGFRFLKIEAVDEPVIVAGVQAAFDHRDIERIGSFSSSDELLNKIWDTGAYTVFLNMQEYLWDGIKRDRLVWIGDMYPELMTILATYGDNEVIKKNLDFSSKYIPFDKWMSGIPSYNLWWIKIQLDYYMWSGDFDYLNSHRDYFVNMTKHFLSLINPDGTNEVGEYFTEWNSRETKWEKAGFQAVLSIGMNAASEIAEILGETELSRLCKTASINTAKQIYPYHGNKQIAAMLSLAGMVDTKKTSDEIIKPDGGKGLSTFWGYFTLLALLKSNDVPAALDIIKEFWGKMLELGATSFWESFCLEWAENAAGIEEPVPDGKSDIHGDFGEFCYQGFRHSLCHGWASGPTAFMSEAVLGVKVIEPGCKKVQIKPNLANLEWVKGSYPTPYGEIKIEHRLVGDKVVTEFTAPAEVEIIL